MKHFLILLSSIVLFGFTLSDNMLVMPFEKDQYGGSKRDFGQQILHVTLRETRASMCTYIRLKENAPILSVGKGFVVKADTSSRGFGRQVQAVYNDSIKVRYAHLKEILVDVGDSISTGQNIGIVGSSGYVTGVRLGLQLWVNDSLVDPANYIDLDL